MCICFAGVSCGLESDSWPAHGQWPLPPRSTLQEGDIEALVDRARASSDRELELSETLRAYGLL